MELENEKTEILLFAIINWLPFQRSKISKYEDHFSVFFVLNIYKVL